MLRKPGWQGGVPTHLLTSLWITGITRFAASAESGTCGHGVDLPVDARRSPAMAAFESFT
jgi:hypothetical protein